MLKPQTSRYMYISTPIRNTHTVFSPLLAGAKSSEMDKTLKQLLIFPLTAICVHQGCHTLCAGHLLLFARLPACTANHKKTSNTIKTRNKFARPVK